MVYNMPSRYCHKDVKISFLKYCLNTFAAPSCYCSNWLERSCLLSKPCTIPLPLCDETLTLNFALGFLVHFYRLHEHISFHQWLVEYNWYIKFAIEKCSVDQNTVYGAILGFVLNPVQWFRCI